MGSIQTVKGDSGFQPLSPFAFSDVFLCWDARGF
jgi:hypothetical protein